MKLPTRDECYRLMCEMGMMDHIVVHSVQVCRVATVLAENLAPAGIRLNFDLIRASALLHDITKTRSFKTKENHAETGGQYLTELGYAEVGSLVRQHVRLDDYPQKVSLNEAVILNYADKRVLHEKVVSLDKRADYILEKYTKVPEDRQRVYLLWQKTREIEDEIFGALSFSPDDLNDLINAEDRSRDFEEYQRVCGVNFYP
jgi:putative nucleotidyltransferase with HDIG domain